MYDNFVVKLPIFDASRVSRDKFSYRFCDVKNCYELILKTSTDKLGPEPVLLLPNDWVNLIANSWNFWRKTMSETEVKLTIEGLLLILAFHLLREKPRPEMLKRAEVLFQAQETRL